ncbi:MAG TPA: amidohydrolase [Phycisphaerae bacterium]|nr:amidohydrolase [Phycisphaerae bacterium]
MNAKVWTADPQRAEAAAFLVRDGRFAYVGDELGARKRARRGAHVVDAGGRRILPGLIDSHLHLIDGGLQLSRLNLRDVPDRAAFVDAIAKHVADLPPGQWVQGGRWSTESWPDPAQPRREWIDAVTPNHPMLLSRMDGHAALANSVALDKAGIDRHGPQDPPGGQIERDPATNEPTGILKDAAIDLVSKQIPQPSDAELDAALERAMRHANAHGVTCVHTMSEFRHLAAFDRAREKKKLTLRIRQYVSDNWEKSILEAAAHQDDQWLRVVGCKEYADGSLGSRTAFMAGPYKDNPLENSEWRGLLRENLQTDGLLISFYMVAGVHRFALAVHAIGDQANHLVLNSYENFKTSQLLDFDRHIRAGKPRRKISFYEFTDPPARIEHAQHLLLDDIPRFAKLGMVASMQPLHKADDARYAENAIGRERCESSYAFRTLLHYGTIVAFGSDWPVVSLDPFLGVRAAVTGLSLEGKVFVPEQNITVEEALTCYTRNAARAARDEASLGMIREGMLADFVILDEDPFTHDFRQETTIKPSAVYVGGRQVFECERGSEAKDWSRMDNFDRVSLESCHEHR